MGFHSGSASLEMLCFQCCSGKCCKAICLQRAGPQAFLPSLDCRALPCAIAYVSLDISSPYSGALAFIFSDRLMLWSCSEASGLCLPHCNFDLPCGNPGLSLK